MDLWLVAVIAAGGYVAKHWQNPSKNHDSFSRLSSGDPCLEKIEPPSCPLSRLAWRKRSGRACSADRRDSKEDVSDLNSKTFERHEDCNVLTISNLSWGSTSDSNLLELGDVNPQISDFENGNYSGSTCPGTSTVQGHVYCSTRRKKPLRTKFSGAQVVRPLDSLESCLMAQLRNGHSELEEYVFSSFTSPTTPVVRPLLVRDGSRITSKVNDNSFFPLVRKEETYLQNKRYPQKTEHVIGIHPLPEIDTLKSSKKKATETGKGWNERTISSDRFSGKHLAAQHGLSSGRLLFFLGVSVGAMSSITFNKREIDRLNELLKHTENLVDDLHEELEMNDSIIVKELASENHELHDTCENHSNYSELNALPEQQMDNLAEFNLKEQYKPKADAKSDSLSRIEAELEAELERLGLNMESSIMDKRFSDPSELGPDLFTDFTREDLRAKIQEGNDEGPPKLYDNKVDTFRNQTGNSAVSPRELSLRLHEVIQSRLEERIKELEVALENSQRKIQLLELREKKHCWSNLDYDLGSPPSREIQIVDSTLHPFVMDLSGEALDAYHEAYEEIIEMDESEDSGFNHNTDRGVNSLEWCTNGVQNGEVKRMAFSPLNSQKNSSELSSENLVTKGKTSVVSEMNFVEIGDNSDSSDDDVMERYLIKEIVERTKRGSPVVLNAERILYSMDEDDR